MSERIFTTIEQRQWEVAVRNAQGDVEVHELHYERKLPEVDPQDYENMFVRRVPPVRIIPSKRKIPETDVETTVFIPDTHYPYQDKRAVALAKTALKVLNPTTIVFLGDEIDAVNFSRFSTRQEWQGSLQQGLDEFHHDLAEIKADNPQSKLVQHDSNHHIRLERMIREYNGDLLGLKRANAQNELGVLTIGYLLRHQELGVEYISGYPNSEYWHEDHLKSTHGSESVSGGSTMARVIGRGTVSVVSGHSHRAELVYRTFQDGRHDRTIFGLNPGILADPDLVPKNRYATNDAGKVVPQHMNWQQSIGVVYHTPEMASPHLLPITEAGIHVFDRTYKL